MANKYKSSASSLLEDAVDVIFGHRSGARKSTHDKHTKPRSGSKHSPNYVTGGNRKSDVEARRNKNK